MKKRVYTVLTVLAISACVNTGSAKATAPSDIVCIAHRGGASTHTEETAFTYEASISASVKEVEGDVRWTATGYPYMLHDSTLGLFGHPSVALSTISGATATGLTYVSATGDKLLSLYALRQQLIDAPAVRLQLELKTILTEDQWTMLATRVDPIKDRTTITSFNKDTVQEAQIRGYRTGLLSTVFDETTEAPIFAISFSALDADNVALHKRRGVDTQTWTIDTESQWNTAADAGVTGIITNDPVGCMEWTEGT